jgi:integron integrase
MAIEHEDFRRTEHLCTYWLRNYLNFCQAFHHSPKHRESLPHFLRALKERNISDARQQQASLVVSLHYKLLDASAGHTAMAQIPKHNPHSGQGALHQSLQGERHSHTTSPDTAKPAIGCSWKAEYTHFEHEILVRHYSPKTLKTYRYWVRKFQAFTRSKDPKSLCVTDVKDFLTWLAVKKQVAATTQNQAFNALLFFYRHVLRQEFGKINGVVRAKRKPYIPVVLSRHEIDMILAHLAPPYDLLVKLLYGCGLRVGECLNLRLHCFNFDAEILTIHDGKGRQDRTVPMPVSLIPELRAQLEVVKDLYRHDLDAKYAGVFLMNALERKYKNAAKTLIWQWFFPAKQLTKIPENGELRRYHLHETHVSRALKEAVEQAGIFKRVTTHTFRHSFASHLLQANYDIRTIQELLGHYDVRTTMKYTHTVKSTTRKDPKSPLDF